MDRATKTSLRKKLEEMRSRFSYEAERKAREGRDAGPERAADIADQALTTYTKELSFSQSENETELLQMVNASLDRMEDGTYGTCLSCQREIGLKRLEAVPWTHLCIDCQTLAEEMDADHRGAA
jgi:DnaK suppressor protein